MSPADQLRLAHMVGLAAVATWLGTTQAGGWLPAAVLALVAGAGEMLPRGALRELGAPALALAAAAVAWAVGDGSHGAIHALLGTLVAALLLIPARPGTLRLLAPLAAVELIVLGLANVPGPSPWLAAAVLAPTAALALAIDAWLEARLGDRRASQAPRWLWLPWAVAPALLAGALGAFAYLPAAATADALRPAPVRQVPGAAPAPRSAPGRLPGDHVGIDPGGPPPRDPAPVARLFLAEDPGGLVYLRLAACSRLQRDQGRLRWLPAPGEVELPDTPPPPGATLGDLVRMAGLGDAVLLPDDGDWAGVADQWADGDGNRWRPDLGEAIRSYRVAVDGGTRREPPADLALAAAICRELPPILDAWPWEEVLNPAWATMGPVEAAEAIAQRLRARCAYDLDPPQGGSDPFATFLFGPLPERRGTCEHFAGAAGLLLRRSGHPARLVAGFASAEWDGGGVLFRRLHAHAWVEVLLPDGRWRRVDPTPPVAHDLLARLDRAAHPPPRPDDAVPLRPRDGDRGHDLGAVLITLGAMVAAIVVVAWRARRLRDRRDPQVAHRRRGAELVELARAVGVRVEPRDTATAICARITARTGCDLSATLAAHLAARFGGGPPAPPWPRPEMLRPPPRP